MIEPKIVIYPFGDATYTSALFYGADVRKSLRGFKAGSVQCVVTSPPYWGLRDYGTGSWEGGDPACAHSVGGQVQDTKYTGAITTGQRPGVDASHCRLCGATRVDDQIGLEQSPEDYVIAMVEVFREVRRVLRDDGVLWLNLGDSFAGASPPPTTYRLRADLTPDQITYVLSELSKARTMADATVEGDE